MSPSTGQTRKSVKLSQPLHRDLTRYALAAGAAGVSVLALSSRSEAQIVYTPAHEMIGRNGQILIDLNHDGITDVIIREVSYGGTFPGNELEAAPNTGKGAIRVRFGNAAVAMPAGQEIGPGESFFPKRAILYGVTNFQTYYNGFWAHLRTPHYLGIAFLINGETHYGWARLSVQFNVSERDIVAGLSGYAYQTQPNTSIRAGDTGDRDESQMSSPEPEPSATLGALALGAKAIPIWRSTAQ